MNKNQSLDIKNGIGPKLNIISILLLILLIVGVFAMPRFNYEKLVAQQADLLNRQRTLEDKFHDLNILKGDDEKKRYAVFETMDQIPQLLDTLHKEYSRFLGVFDYLKDLDRRIKILENAPSDGVNEPVLRQEALEESLGYLEPIDLETELKKKADTLIAKAIYEGQFEDFINSCLKSKILPFENQEDILPEALESFARFFSTFKLAIMWTDYKERVQIRELIKAAIEKGAYDEVPITKSGETLDMPGLKEAGYVHVKKYKELGVQRVFRFPYSEYPEMVEFISLRENALHHLLSDAVKIH